MKKMLSYAMIFMMSLMVLWVPSFKSYAADLSMSVSSSSVNIGDTVTVTVNAPSGTTATVDVYFPTDIFEFGGATGTANASGGTVTTTLGEPFSSSFTVTLKAKTSGTATISAKAIKAGDSTTGDVVSVGSASKTITVNNQTPSNSDNGGGATTEPQKSGDNSLSSLKLSSGTLSPSFKYNVTKYTATVGYDVTKVVVSAKTTSDKATIESVTGNGTVNLSVGENTIQVVVKAENGVKATYTIVVTRKAQDTTAEPEPSESTSESETTVENNEVLQWNGEQLHAATTIPTESVPAGFESASLVVNGQQMEGLSFTKGDLKVLYLNNSNGAGSLYVYDEAQQMIYPFIKLTSEKSYVMVLLPDEANAPVPEGFESCTFSIEGKGLVSAYQLKEDVENPVEHEILEDSTISWNPFGAETFYAAEAKTSDFYLIYCMNDAGEKGWYMYDSVEETFQRYLASAYSVQTGGEPSDEQDKYAELEKELETAKMTQYIIIGVAVAVMIILVIVIVVLVLRNRSEEDFFDEYEDEDEYEENDEEDDGDDVYVNTLAEEVEDDEIEIEFYEMTSVEEVTEESENEDDDLEFIDFE